MINISTTIRHIQQFTGHPRFNFMGAEEMVDIIQLDVIPEWSTYFPYKTIFPLYETDLVDKIKYPALYKLNPTDCAPDAIWDCGFAYPSGDYALGGYIRDMNRSLYGSFGLTTAIYNQIKTNLMSMVQPMQTTTEYINPGMAQLHPKERLYHYGNNPVLIELVCNHSPDCSTIHPAHRKLWNEFCLQYIRAIIYERYKDYEDETVAGHQLKTKISEYNGAADKLNEVREKMNETYIHDPDRIDYFYII